MNDTDVITATIDRQSHTVLVVDDNAATRYATGRVLKASGFKVMEAASGLDAIEKSAVGVSAVVLDVNLPDLNGFNVCRVIRQRPSTEHLPIVHLSATHVASEDRVTGLNSGADAYLVHPAEPAVLVATVQALIRARTAEEKLRRSEQLFRAIYDHAQSGIALLDAAGVFADANGAMQRMLGRSREDLVGTPLASFTAPGQELTPAEAHWRGEVPMMHADGRIVFLEWTISEPIENGLRIATATDVSERHELERRRREVLEREQSARAAAEHHSRTKDDFIAVLSHELRTPLNSIVGWVAILQRRNPTPEALKGLEAIERNVKAQARIISDILDVSRINSGKLRVVRERVNSADLVRNALTALQKDIADRRIEVLLDLDVDADAYLDPSRFEQIFWNLMTNAIKFSPVGGTIEVRLRRSDEKLLLTVRDKGQGIAPEFLPRMFDRFSQSDSPGNRHHGGLGLGLAIVKHLAELHGGSASAHSEGIGHGTTMSVELPVFGTAYAEPPPADLEPSSPGAQDTHARPLEELDILIVEDDTGAAEMLSVILADRGATVRIARDYDTAMDALKSSWPDVVVSDIGLPGRDGYDLVRAIRALPARAGAAVLPAIALTAFARPEDRAKALDAGFNAHLAKPLKPHALVEAVLSVMRPTG